MTRLMEMSVMEAIVSLLAAGMASVWLMGIRSYTRRGLGVTSQTVVTSMLFSGLAVSVFAFDWSPYHLLWLFPAAFVLGFLSLVFPFSLLNLPASLYAWLVCIGVREEKARSAGAGR